MPGLPHDVLRDIRTRLDLTQRAFGQKLGVTTRTINRWEHGQSEMPQSALPRAIALLRGKDAAEADRLSVAAGLPDAVAQQEARNTALDHAIYHVADSFDVSPHRVRDVLTTFLTFLVASGMSAVDARARLGHQVVLDGARRATEAAEARRQSTASKKIPR